MIGERRPRPRARALCIRAIASATLGGGGDFAIPGDPSRRAYGFVNAGFPAAASLTNCDVLSGINSAPYTSKTPDWRGVKLELSAKSEVKESPTGYCMGKPMLLRWR